MYFQYCRKWTVFLWGCVKTLQAKLPDLNAAFVKYRTHALECIRSKNYNGAAAALNNINALFPDEYRVAINTVKYDQAMQDRITYLCNHCKTETSYSKIRIFTVNHSLVLEVISGEKTQKVWICPECKKDNEMRNTKVFSEKMAEPYYLKIIPRCPVRLSGLKSRFGFDGKFSSWFYKYFCELEYQLGLYRIEYQSQQDQEDDTDYKDDGKE